MNYSDQIKKSVKYYSIQIKKSVKYYSIPEIFASDDSLPISLENQNSSWMVKLCQSTAPEILFCITIYNEPGSALLYSLAGIKQNLDYLVKMGNHAIAERVTLCLIFDGQEKISVSTLALLKSLNLYTEDRLVTASAMHVFDSKLDMHLVEKCVDIDMLDGKSDQGWRSAYQFSLQQNGIAVPNSELSPVQEVSPRVLVCIKRENASKLNSHWWFFMVFSTYLCPKYCVQMDVGSIPSCNALNELWNFLDIHPEVGAATGSVLVPEPDQFWDLLSVWQFGNFFLDKLLFRPAEDLTGYLSVLPGQFSIFRWQALTSTWLDKKLSTQQPSPLKKYFRGLKQLGAFEATIFLTEDRVLGFELATSFSASWKLAFLPSVVTITDSCQSLPELLRQRRRWINGSLACHVWSLIQIPEYLSKQKITIQRKLRFLSSIPLYLLRSFTQWFSPSFVILFYVLICKALKDALINFPWVNGLINPIFSLVVCLFVTQILFCQFGTQSKYLLRANMICSSLFRLTALVILTSLGCYLPLIVIISTLLSIYIITKLHLPSITDKFWVNLPLYFLILSDYSCLLYAYAAFNIHDHSWGTKGLTEYKFQKRLYVSYILFWLLSNLLFLLGAFSLQSAIPILFLIGQIDLLIGILAGLISVIPIIKKRRTMNYHRKSLQRIQK
jgi:cellulose synthase/poly-beta-1,6-N-acetylglucosamine synthase-like glycosyltransferase